MKTDRSDKVVSPPLFTFKRVTVKPPSFNISIVILSLLVTGTDSSQNIRNVP